MAKFRALKPKPLVAHPLAIPAPEFPRDGKKPQAKLNRVHGPHQITLSQTERDAAIQVFDAMFPKYSGLLRATVMSGNGKATP